MRARRAFGSDLDKKASGAGTLVFEALWADVCACNGLAVMGTSAGLCGVIWTRRPWRRGRQQQDFVGRHTGGRSLFGLMHVHRGFAGGAVLQGEAFWADGCKSKKAGTNTDRTQKQQLDTQLAKNKEMLLSIIWTIFCFVQCRILLDFWVRLLS